MSLLSKGLELWKGQEVGYHIIIIDNSENIGLQPKYLPWNKDI